MPSAVAARMVGPPQGRIFMVPADRATMVARVVRRMNILPWGGPTIRAHTALASMTGTEPTVTEFFMPVLPAVLVGLVCVLVVAIILGSGEKKRLGAWC